MPNHFHAVVAIQSSDGSYSLSEFVQAFKRIATHEIIQLVHSGDIPPFDQLVWKKSFHDRIIRNEKEYLMVWEYISNNPLQWELDRYYTRPQGE